MKKSKGFNNKAVAFIALMIFGMCVYGNTLLQEYKYTQDQQRIKNYAEAVKNK